MSVIIALLTTEPASLELEQAVDVKGNAVRTVKSVEERACYPGSFNSFKIKCMSD